MRSNKKRNFFSFSRKARICKAGMPKNHSIHDKAQAPPKSTWRVDYVLKTAKSNMASIWICMGFKSLNCFQRFILFLY